MRFTQTVPPIITRSMDKNVILSIVCIVRNGAQFCDGPEHCLYVGVIALKNESNWAKTLNCY